MLFPIVHVLGMIGISQPGEWTAEWVEARIVWPARIDELRRREPGRRLTHAEIWREFHGHRRPPEPR